MERDGQERRYKAPDHANVRIVCLLVLLVNENGGISDERYPNAAGKVNASERCWLRLTKADGGTAACLLTDDFTGHGDRPHTALERFTACRPALGAQPARRRLTEYRRRIRRRYRK